MIQSLLLASLVFAAPMVFGQEGERVLKPVIEAGDRWTYRGLNVLGFGVEEYEMEVASVHAGLIQVVCTRKRDAKEFDGTFTDEWSSTTSCSGFINQPPPRFLRFPMVPGDSHTVKYTSHRVRETGFIHPVEGKVVVKGWDTVEVPAGRFRAMKIEAEMSAVQANGSVLRRFVSIWYSPEVRNTVKFESRARGADTFSNELLSYKLVQ